MSTIKKNFTMIHSILLNNQDKKVSDIMDLLTSEMESKVRDKNHFEDEHGFWIFCYYHKEWELVSQVEYGSKASSTTGYNTMCKVGVNCWTKQQRDFKTNKSNLLERVMLDADDENHLDPTMLREEIAKLEVAKDKIVPLSEFYYDEANEINDDMIEEANDKLDDRIEE